MLAAMTKAKRELSCGCGLMWVFPGCLCHSAITNLGHLVSSDSEVREVSFVMEKGFEVEDFLLIGNSVLSLCRALTFQPEDH